MMEILTSGETYHVYCSVLTPACRSTSKPAAKYCWYTSRRPTTAANSWHELTTARLSAVMFPAQAGS